MKIKCLVVDDEPLALRVIESHIEKLEGLELVAKCSNAMQAMEVLRRQNVDLIFLDIQMPELTGVEFIKSMKSLPMVIFTTAYRNYAIEAFDLDVLDYLLKPISFDRFLKAIDKFYLRKPENISVHSGSGKEESSAQDFIFIRKNKTVIKLLMDEIVFIESMKDYVQIHTEDNTFSVKFRISQLEQNLPETKFIRIHKSFIIPIDKIDTISPRSVGVANKELPIGRSYKALVLKRLNYYEL